MIALLILATALEVHDSFVLYILQSTKVAKLVAFTRNSPSFSASAPHATSTEVPEVGADRL
jgi:hypothetical protein